MSQPKVSIILPVGEDAPQLRACLDSLLAQPYQNFEIICTNYGATEETLRCLEEYREKDPRVRLSEQTANCAGSAANDGISLAEGEYALFLNPSDVAARELLEVTIPRIQTADAEMIAFNGYLLREDGRKTTIDGYCAKTIPAAGTVFSRREFPDSILSVLTGGLRYRLIRLSLIRENNIRFPELSSQWEVPFCALCDAYAQRITVTGWRLITQQSGTQADVHGVLAAVDALVTQLTALPFAEEIRQALLRRLVEYTTAAFRRTTDHFDSEDARMLYLALQERFRWELFAKLDGEKLPAELLCFFDTILHTPYEEMLGRCSREMVVSFTSFPGRISFVSSVVENVRRQTKAADKVLLYLASEQFPGLEEALPQKLREQAEAGLVQIKWCRDIRSHKKYHYVMQEYPHSLIVTLDDDLTYPDDMLQKLFDCYLCHPEAVSAMRAHLVVTDAAAEQVLPYDRWVKEYRQFPYTPSSQLFVTSGAGTLFPPKVLHPMTFDLEKAWKLCPYADDIWLNIMTLINGRRVVLAADDFTMQCMPGSQEDALQSINVDDNQNDVQFRQTRSWLKQEFGEDILWRYLTTGASRLSCQTVWEMSDQYLALDEDRKRVQNKLHQVWRDKTNRENDVKRLKEDIKRYKSDIDRYREDIAKLNARLKNVQGQLDDELRSFRLLRKVRNAYRSCRKNGVKYTLALGARRISAKLRRR